MENELTYNELTLLQALHKIMMIEPDLLADRACDRYNELAGRADEENLVW